MAQQRQIFQEEFKEVLVMEWIFYFRVAFKPVATIIQKQNALDNSGNIVEMQGKGRHDPCVVPRAVPIVEAMAALVIADYYLLNKLAKL